MKMKPLFGMIAGAVLLLSSCATSNEVNGGGIFQKRKYNKGFYWNRSAASNSLTSKNEETTVGETTDIYSAQISSDIESEELNLVQSEVNQNAHESSNMNSAPVSKTKSSFTNSLSDTKSFVRSANPIKKLSQMETKLIQKTAAKAKAPGREGDLGYLLGIVLIVLLIIIIFSLLRDLLYDIFPFLGPLLALILLIVLVILLLRWLGIM